MDGNVDEKVRQFTYEFFRLRFPEKISSTNMVLDTAYFNIWVHRFKDYSLEKLIGKHGIAGADSRKIIRRLIRKWKSDGLLIISTGVFNNYLDFGDR